MKWIKNFNESAISDVYHTIDLAEWDSLFEKWGNEKFSTWEISKFESLFKKWEDRKEIKHRYVNPKTWYPKDNLSEIESTLILTYGGRYFGKEITINKLGDGWYLIDEIPNDAHNFAWRNGRTYESYREHYKCDQFQGVVSLLEELTTQKINIYESLGNNIKRNVHNFTDDNVTDIENMFLSFMYDFLEENKTSFSTMGEYEEGRIFFNIEGPKIQYNIDNLKNIGLDICVLVDDYELIYNKLFKELSKKFIPRLQNSGLLVIHFDKYQEIDYSSNDINYDFDIRQISITISRNDTKVFNENIFTNFHEFINRKL